MSGIINRGKEWSWMDSLEQKEVERIEKSREQFVRLAQAIIRSRYKYKPQRQAIAAKMYRKWMERKHH